MDPSDELTEEEKKWLRERLGRTITSIRNAQDLTRFQVATSSDIKVAHLAQIEKGFCDIPDVEELAWLTDALNIKNEDLLLEAAGYERNINGKPFNNMEIDNLIREEFPTAMTIISL